MATGQPDSRGRAVVVVDVSGYPRVDLVLVDALCRVRLAAGRLGARLEIVGGRPDLGRLLELVGLLEAVGSEPLGQAEPGEQPGVEEVVDVGDPAVAQFQDLDRPGDVPAVGPGGPVLGEGR